MIIAAKNLHKYLSGLSYPVDVLQPKGDRIAATLDRPELERMIAVEAVIGIGSWNRIKSLRVNTIISTKGEPEKEYSSTSLLDMISPGAISHKRQQKGAARWIQRIDMAKSGQAGTRRTLHLGSWAA